MGSTQKDFIQKVPGFIEFPHKPYLQAIYLAPIDASLSPTPQMALHCDVLGKNEHKYTDAEEWDAATFTQAVEDVRKRQKAKLICNERFYFLKMKDPNASLKPLIKDLITELGRKGIIKPNDVKPIIGSLQPVLMDTVRLHYEGVVSEIVSRMPLRKIIKMHRALRQPTPKALQA